MFRIIVYTLLASAVLGFLNAFVLIHLWEWFIVPFGLPKIGMAWAYGLCVTANFILFKPGKHDPNETFRDFKSRLLSGVAQCFVMGAFFLIIGSIAALHM